jgi:hypothetical protein
MAMLDSAPVFKDRLRSCGISTAGQEAIIAAGYDTVSKFAFCCTATPGQDDAPYIAVLEAAYAAANPVLTLNGAETACWRRAFFECHTLMMGDMRDKVEGKLDVTPRKVPVAERAHRLEQQVARLPSLNLKKGELDLSHSLMDLVYQIREENMLRYVSAEVCTMRSQELAGIKRTSTVQTNNQGHLVVVTTETVCTVDITSEYKIRCALQRRGLALDRVNLLKYELHEEWLAYLFSQVTRDVPEHFHTINVQQALQADRQLFTIMAELTLTGIQVVGAQRPLDVAIESARQDPLLTMMLMPMPGRGPPGSATGGGARPLPVVRTAGVPGKVGAPGTGKRFVRKTKLKEAKLAAAAGADGTSKGKGKGKGMPLALAGQNSRNPLGQNICYGYNLHSCPAAPGAVCPRGLHICTKCFGSHPQDECPP